MSYIRIPDWQSRSRGFGSFILHTRLSHKQKSNAHLSTFGFADPQGRYSKNQKSLKSSHAEKRSFILTKNVF